MVKLTISILVHENFTYIHEALASILAQTQTSFELIVVINSGDPDKIAYLQQEFPDFTYIINEKPQGFARNHNMVMAQAKSPYIALLNDDILIKDNALDRQIAYLDAHPDVGMIGAQLEHEDGTLQVTAYSDPGLLRMIYKISGLATLTNQRSLLRKWLIKAGVGRLISTESLNMSAEIRDVDVLKAAAIIVRRDVFIEVGGIDETTRAYGEEIDWNWRIRQTHWRIVLFPDVRITHFGLGQAALNLSGWQIVEDRKGILNYYIKHRSSLQVIIIRLAIITLHSLQALIALVLRRGTARDHLRTAMMALTWRRKTQQNNPN